MREEKGGEREEEEAKRKGERERRERMMGDGRKGRVNARALGRGGRGGSPPARPSVRPSAGSGEFSSPGCRGLEA